MIKAVGTVLSCATEPVQNFTHSRISSVGVGKVPARHCFWTRILSCCAAISGLDVHNNAQH